MTSTYDSLDDLGTTTDAKGVETVYTYDSEGNLTQEQRALDSDQPSGTTTNQTWTYNHADTAHPGDVTSVVDPLGHTTTYTYDSAGNVASKTDAAGDKTTDPSYNALGQPLSTVSPRGNVKGATASQFTTTYTYDAAGNRLTVTGPLGHKTTSTYDADGNLQTVTDARSPGNVTTYVYDANNQRTQITRADGTQLKSSYDPNGNLLTQTDGANNATTYTYDALDHLASSTDPLNRTTNYTYDAVGNLRYLTDPLGRTTTYNYDPADRLSQLSYSDGATPSASFGYDNNGQRTSMSDGTGSSSYTYDRFGRLTSETDGHGDTASFGYDLGDNQTSVIYPNTKTVTRTFDVADRLATVKDWLANTTAFSYDADSDLTGIAFPNGTHDTDKLAYDNAGNESSTTMLAGSKTMASITYTRDPDNQVASETRSGLPGAAQSYTYNKLNQLTQAGTSAYAYDSADNPTTLASATPLTYDAANELTQTPSATLSYDGIGERTGASPTGGTSSTLAYDQAGRLTSFTKGTTNATYAYGGDGLRGAQTTGGATQYFAWDTSESLPLLLSDGSSSYVYDADGLPLEQISSAGTATFYHHDQLGSTRLLTSASGTNLASFSYDAYGNLTGSTGTVTTPLGYAGQYTDSVSGMQYLRARYYDPATAEFVTRDPADEETRSAYGYTADNPLSGIDPLGLCGTGSVGAIFDCVNPVSKGNLAYQGAKAVVKHARAVAEGVGTVLACAMPYVDVVTCPEVLVGTAALNVSINDVHEVAALQHGCGASSYLSSDLLEASFSSLGASVDATVSLATRALAGAHDPAAGAARGAVGFFNRLATGSGLLASGAAASAESNGCGCGT